jgi:outer membrane receptor protein involved in Fe transport
MIDLSAGGGYTVDELLLETLLETVDSPSADGLTPGRAVRNTLAGYTADVASMDVTAKLKYKWSDVFDFGLDVVYRHHNIKDDGIASYLPGWEIKPSITLRPVKPLSVDVSYGTKGNREAQVRRIDRGSTSATDAVSTVKLDHLQQLDAKVAYRFCDAFVLNASLNNLLFRKQSVWYGMPEPGFTFLVGGTLKF